MRRRSNTSNERDIRSLSTGGAAREGSPQIPARGVGRDRCWIYQPNTSGTNLRKHLRMYHYETYAAVANEKQWPSNITRHIYPEGPNAAALIPMANAEDIGVIFNDTVFLDFLVKFIVTDDQVSANVDLVLTF